MQLQQVPNPDLGRQMARNTVVPLFYQSYLDRMYPKHREFQMDLGWWMEAITSICRCHLGMDEHISHPTLRMCMWRNNIQLRWTDLGPAERFALPFISFQHSFGLNEGARAAAAGSTDADIARTVAASASNSLKNMHVWSQFYQTRGKFSRWPAALSKSGLNKNKQTPDCKQTAEKILNFHT